jgi:hypothetical protein
MPTIFHLHKTIPNFPSTHNKLFIKRFVWLSACSTKTCLIPIRQQWYGKNYYKLIHYSWSISFRIYNASTIVETSLKFDIQLQSNPENMFYVEVEW